MVSKKSPADKKSTTTSAKAKSKTSKSTAKKVSAASQKATATKVLDKQVPVKANIDPMEKVMAIKAKNDEKKASKVAKKDKNNKTTAVVEPKEEKKCCLCSGCKNGMIAAWGRAYNNLFNFKGRTSRFEFWSFNLLNFIFAGALVCALLVLIGELGPTYLYMSAFGVLALFILVSFFVYLAISVRRLHDTGNTAWKGFYRPTIFSFLLTVVLSGFALVLGQDTNALLANTSALTVTCLSLFVLAFFASLFALIYYSTKILLFTGFFEEDGDNEFGAALYNDKCYKFKAFKYAILYYILVGVVNVISEAAENYVAATNYMQGLH